MILTAVHHEVVDDQRHCLKHFAVLTVVDMSEKQDSNPLKQGYPEYKKTTKK